MTSLRNFLGVQDRKTQRGAVAQGGVPGGGVETPSNVDSGATSRSVDGDMGVTDLENYGSQAPSKEMYMVSGNKINNRYANNNDAYYNNQHPNVSNGVLPGGGITMKSPKSGSNAQPLVNAGGMVEGKMSENPYLQRLAEEKAIQAQTYTPDAENRGRGVANWLKSAFKRPETEAGRRAQIQNITAIGDVLRHAANLYYTSKGATPQNIQSQTMVNDAMWKQEDALKAEKDRKAQELAVKRAKQEADEKYKAGNLALRQESNNIAKANYGLAAEKHGWQKDEHPYVLAEKVANANKAVSQANQEKVKENWLPKEKEVNYRLANQRIAQSAAATAASIASKNHSKASTRLVNQKLSDAVNGVNPVSNNAGTFSRKHPITSQQKENIVYRLWKDTGVVTKEQYNELHTTGSYFDTERHVKVTADMLIASALEEYDNDGAIREIMTSNGYTYKPYNKPGKGQSVNIKK